MLTIIPVKTSFSTADASHPAIKFDAGQLFIQFTDWREKPIAVTFENVAAFSWRDAMELLDGERDDSVYEVLQSRLLSEHSECGSDPDAQSLRHFRLNFNAAGQLEVICTSLTHDA